MTDKTTALVLTLLLAVVLTTGAQSDGPADIAAALCAGETGTAFANECGSRGIDPAGGSAMKQFPLSYKGSRVSVTMAAKTSTAALTDAEEENAARGAKKLDLQIVARRPGKGSKMVTTLNAVMASSYQVDGYLLSPFEARMLVIFETSARGFEGDMSTTLRFTGCHLELGFK